MKLLSNFLRNSLTVFEITSETNQTFGLTGSEISQTKLKRTRPKFIFTTAMVVIGKNQIFDTKKVADNLSGRFSNQSEQSNFTQSFSDGLALFSNV